MDYFYSDGGVLPESTFALMTTIDSPMLSSMVVHFVSATNDSPGTFISASDFNFFTFIHDSTMSLSVISILGKIF